MIRFAVFLAALTALATAAVVASLVVGAFLDPTASLWGVAGSAVWAPFGPFLLMGVLVALLVGFAARRCGLRRLGMAVLALATPAALGAAYLLGRIARAAIAAGAAIDVPATLMPARMDAPAPDVVQRFRRVGPTDLQVALYLPPPSTVPSPVLAYFHGGGFMTGSFTETAADLRWFADQGWLVASFEYRLFAPGRPTWNQAPEDVACALVWLARNAARLGADADRIALMGDSAGGNLAVNLGHAAAAGRAPAACGADVPVPAAIAVLYPALDPTSIYEKGYPVPGFKPATLIEGYVGGPPQDHPDRIAAITSARFLTADAPPTLIVLPENDSLVVAEGTRAYAEAALRAGADVTLVTIPFANHVFNQIAANSLGNQIGRSLRLRFLQQHAD